MPCRRPLQGFTLWLAGALIPMASSQAVAQALTGLLTSSASLTSASGEAGASRSRGFNQNLQLNWNRAISPVLNYRFSLRASDAETAASSRGTSNWSTGQTVEPSLDMTLAGPKYSLAGGIRFRETFSDTNQSERLRIDEGRQFIRFFWTPEVLPQLTVQYDRGTSGDDQSPKLQDTTDQRLHLGGQYTLGKLAVNYAFTNQLTDDNLSGRSREQRNHTGSASYADSFWKDRFLANASFQMSYLESIEKLPVTSAAAGLTDLQILRVLTGLEFNPLNPDTSNYPLGGTTALTDGNASSGIALLVNQDVAGKADAISRKTDTSIVVELTGSAPVTLIRLTVAADPAESLSLAERATQLLALFEVFISQDNLSWAKISAGAITRAFDAAANRMEFSFPEVTGRFVKLVLADDSRQPAFPAILATEISVQGPGAGGGQRRLTTRTLQQTGALGLSLKPVEWAVLSYNATISNARQDPSQTSDTTGSQGVALSTSLPWTVTGNLTYQNTFTRTDRTGGEETDLHLYGLTLGASPLPALSHSLSLIRSENSRDGTAQSQSDALTFTTAATPYPLLNTDLNFTASKSKSFTDGAESLGYTVSLNGTAQLRPRLMTTGGYSFQRSDTTGPTTATTQSHGASMSATYTLSRVIHFNARVDYQDSIGSRTVNQQYRMDWIPTPKTSVFLSAQRSDRFGTTGGFTHGLTTSGRWNISRALDLSLTYSFSRATSGDFVHAGSGTLSLRF